MKKTKGSLFPYYKKVELNETCRTYLFPGGERIQIDNPQYIIVSDNGHRVLDGMGRPHYIPYGWIHLWWEPKGEDAFYCEGVTEGDEEEDEPCAMGRITPDEEDEINRRSLLLQERLDSLEGKESVDPDKRYIHALRVVSKDEVEELLRTIEEMRNKATELLYRR